MVLDMKIDGINLSRHYIIIDANALMHKHFQRFFRTRFVAGYNNTLKQKQTKDFRILIPEAVFTELNKLKTNPGTQKLQTRTDAMDGMNLAKSLVKANYAEVMRSDYTGTIGGFNDVSLLSIFVELRRHANVALITNDRGLATDVLNLNHLHSVKSKFNLKALFVDLFDEKLKEWVPNPDPREEALRFKSEILRK
jgi:rRNA-processing protein FCF1